MFAKKIISILTAVILAAAPAAVYADSGDVSVMDYPSELSARELLGLTLDYCSTMDTSKYITDNSQWTAFQTALTNAQTSYADTSISDDSSTLTTLRSTLESAKASLLFVSSTDEGNPLPMRDLSTSEIVYEMGVGWNLGNTMDGHSSFHPSETAWQSVVTTKEIIKSVHDAGFNTVRIPVTWGDMIDDENGYAIDSDWISRVQDIVDYCVSLDMYAIINIHHDGAEQTGWLRVAADDIDSVYEKFECVWRNIATYFRDYDEHLIFESANELTCSADDKNGTAAKTYDIPIIVNLNQIFVNVVRSTGSNNTTRWLSSVSHYANAGTDSAFKLPTDNYNSSPKLMFSAHIYKHSTYTTWTYSEVYEVVDQLKKMHNKFGSYPMILGEYGNRNKMNSDNPSGYNDLDRAYFDEVVTRACQVAGVVPCVWDQGWFDFSQSPDSSWSVWDREGQQPIFKTITDAMMRGIYLAPSTSNKSYTLTDIEKGPEITEITDISLSAKSLKLALGDRETVSADVTPSDTNDVVIWKSANDAVATVSRGKITARGIGKTEITAYSQSGSVSEVIEVTVTPSACSIPITSIETAAESYNVVQDKNISLDCAALPADNDDRVTFTSSNESVAIVNSFGKVTGVSPGTAYVTIAAASGVTKTVEIVVTESEIKNEVTLTLNVLYNDATLGYYSTENGDSITVNEDGQYTLTFDIDRDLSSEGAAAGVEYLKNLTAIYIKDNDETKCVESCQIRYDLITVNGIELTITKGDFKEAVNSSGNFDTDDPINSWNGSAVAEASATNYVANFTTISEPKTISVTFTLSGLTFKENEVTDGTPATSLTASGNADITLLENQSGTISVQAEPLGTTSLVSFVSADNSVAVADVLGVSVGGDGTVSAEITAVGQGETTITARTDSGLSLTFSVKVIGTDVFENASVIIENDVVTGVSADVIGDVPDSFTIIAAVFSDGVLTDAQVKTATPSDISDGKLGVSGFSLDADGKDAKVFIWSSADELIPIS